MSYWEELNKSYPGQYDIFVLPNSSGADLLSTAVTWSYISFAIILVSGVGLTCVSQTFKEKTFNDKIAIC